MEMAVACQRKWISDHPNALIAGEKQGPSHFLDLFSFHFIKQTADLRQLFAAGTLSAQGGNDKPGR